MDGSGLLSLDGEWWVARRGPQVTFVGTLTIDPSGRAVLVSTGSPERNWLPDEHERCLIDGLPGAEELKQSIPDGHVAIPAIHGRASRRSVTLLNCHIHASAEEFTWNPAQIDPSIVLLGANLWPNEYILRGMTVEIEDLAAWAGWASAWKEPLELSRPDPISEMATVGGLTLSIGTDRDIRTETDRLGWRSVVRDHVVLTITKYPGDTNLWTIAEFVEAARRVQDMLTFAVGRSSAIASTTLWFHDDEIADGVSPRVELHLPGITTPSPAAGLVTADKMLFCLADVEFATFLPGWFHEHDRFRPILGALIDIHYAPPQHPYTLVLNAVAGSPEQTHRLLELPGYFLDDREHRRIRTRLRGALREDGLDEDTVNRIIQQVDRRVTLGDRLRDLLDHLGPVTAELFGSAEAAQRWSVAARRSRNDIAHTGITRRYDDRTLRLIAEGATAVVELVVLSELGLTDEQLSASVRRSRPRLAARLAQLLPD